METADPDVNKFGQDQLRQSISKKSSAMRNAAARDADIMRKTGDLERDYYYSLGGMANNAANNVRAMRPYTMLSGTLDTGSQMAYMDYSSRMKTGGGNPSRGSGMSMFNWMYS